MSPLLLLLGGVYFVSRFAPTSEHIAFAAFSAACDEPIELTGLLYRAERFRPASNENGKAP